MTALNTPDVEQGACGRCKQPRPLWRYVPLAHAYEPDSYSCFWCMRDEQPLLCMACTKAERAEEKARPVSVRELMAQRIFAVGAA